MIRRMANEHYHYISSEFNGYDFILSKDIIEPYQTIQYTLLDFLEDNGYYSSNKDMKKETYDFLCDILMSVDTLMTETMTNRVIDIATLVKHYINDQEVRDAILSTFSELDESKEGELLIEDYVNLVYDKIDIDMEYDSFTKTLMNLIVLVDFAEFDKDLGFAIIVGGKVVGNVVEEIYTASINR